MLALIDLMIILCVVEPGEMVAERLFGEESTKRCLRWIRYICWNMLEGIWFMMNMIDSPRTMTTKESTKARNMDLTSTSDDQAPTCLGTDKTASPPKAKPIMSNEALAVLGVDGLCVAGKLWRETRGLRGKCWSRVESEMLGRNDGR